MFMRNLAAALSLAIATLGVGAAADAQPLRGDGYSRDHRGDYDRRYDDRGHHRGWDNRRWDNRGGRGDWNRHHRCWTEWRHHRRVRVCR